MYWQITYSRDEIISISELQKALKSVMENLSSQKKDKIAVSKNNKISTVIVSVDEYERMKYYADLAEYLEILNLVNSRKNENANTTLNEIKSEYGL